MSINNNNIQGSTTIVQNADGSYTKTLPSGQSYVVGTNDSRYGRISGEYAEQMGYGNGIGGVDTSGNVYTNDGNIYTGNGGDNGNGGDKGASKSGGKKLTLEERLLKLALEDSLAELRRQAKEIKRFYNKARSDTYANQLVADKNSNEAMQNLGINSGAIAQAALSSNNALQDNLGDLAEEEAGALTGVEREKSKLKKAYQGQLLSLSSSLGGERINSLL